jgi:hypothetical protein
MLMFSATVKIKEIFADGYRRCLCVKNMKLLGTTVQLGEFTP